ncbi:MAG: hypothetical protein JSS83_19170 [Cyanobacteria bacterium SZAS LIN-3]|nr:hypothetical protein [Cyanobacteria bacterium SZAS LIN-3]
MSRTLVLLSALVAAAVLAVAGGLYFGPDYSSINNVRFDQGRAPSQIFMPPSSDKESRIVRHPNADGSAFDEVWMRDGTTKRVVYDTRMLLRQVFAYYQAPKGQEQGALKYTKEHNSDGHLIAERHLRPDGSLEMDGIFLADGTYMRRLFFPGKSATADGLVVASLRYFDRTWNPLSQTDNRADGTREMQQVWVKDDRTHSWTSYAADGMTALWMEKVKDGDYYRADYVDGGPGMRLETVNKYDGTAFTWYRPDFTASLKVAFVNTKHVQYTVMGPNGKPLFTADWGPNYSAKADAAGDYPRALESVDRYDADGKISVRYSFDNKGVLTSVTLFQGVTTYGARLVYDVDADGWATKVTTYDENFKNDGGKVVARANSRRFADDPAAKVIPSFELPPLKDGLKLWGEPPHYGPY